MTLERTTDDQARVIEEHLPLVQHIVFQVAVHFPRHVDREELARAGALGLVEAARRYEAERGVPFERFAAQRIRGAILDAVRASDWAPRSVRTFSRSLEQAQSTLANELGRSPSKGETARAMGISETQLDRLQERTYRSVVLALDYVAGEADDETVTLGDTLCDDGLEPLAELESRELRSFLEDAVGMLPERHRLVVVGYFLEGRTSQDLARFLGVTESRVSQLRSEALVMLRDGITAQFDEAPKAEPEGRVARRKAVYAAAITARTDWRDRLDACFAAV
jgi:RNA polymerase sigma factor FliA